MQCSDGSDQSLEVDSGAAKQKRLALVNPGTGSLTSPFKSSRARILFSMIYLFILWV